MDEQKALKLFKQAVDAGHEATLTAIPVEADAPPTPAKEKKPAVASHDFTVRVASRTGQLGGDFLRAAADEGVSLGTSDTLLT